LNDILSENKNEPSVTIYNEIFIYFADAILI